MASFVITPVVEAWILRQQNTIVTPTRNKLRANFFTTFPEAVNNMTINTAAKIDRLLMRDPDYDGNIWRSSFGDPNIVGMVYYDQTPGRPDCFFEATSMGFLTFGGIVHINSRLLDQITSWHAMGLPRDTIDAKFAELDLGATACNIFRTWHWDSWTRGSASSSLSYVFTDRYKGNDIIIHDAPAPNMVFQNGRWQSSIPEPDEDDPVTCALIALVTISRFDPDADTKRARALVAYNAARAAVAAAACA